MSLRRFFVGIRIAAAVGLVFAAVAVPAATNLGWTTLPEAASDGPVTVFYPTVAAQQPMQRGPFVFQLAPEAEPLAGNGKLVIVSQGSGGSPWVHADLARALVEAGFVVAMPWHHGDNTNDRGHPGPDSWALRPTEISHAIDAVGRDSRFAPWLDLGHVGVFGMSAGGHAALSMAGGRWSRAGFKNHCDAHLEEGFQTCVGLFTRLHENAFDAVRLAIARWVIDWRFSDDTPQVHHDGRVAAVAAAVPLAADFDMASLAESKVPLALFTSAHDRWLVPRFHADRVLAVCARCEHPVDLPTGGHGAWVSPLPPGLTGLAGDLLNDPPGFDRAAAVPPANRAVVDFFVRHLQAPV